ncbi:hypothetical protein [uncultured Amnibacterium sp.]|uniref:hypothetical protein n=1 Tax=uncultured Amnibacterium sp. TaxID=1631851 RepID=UPI0035CA71ED
MSRREEGAAVPLIVGLFAIALAFITVAAGATSLHLDRLRLLSVADGAALAAAESFRVADVAVRGDEVIPTLTAGAVRAAADAYVAEAGPTGVRQVAIVAAGTDDGRSATVVVRGTWRPPLVGAFLPDGVVVTVESTAAARFR